MHVHAWNHFCKLLSNMIKFECRPRGSQTLIRTQRTPLCIPALAISCLRIFRFFLQDFKNPTLGNGNLRKWGHIFLWVQVIGCFWM